MKPIIVAEYNGENNKIWDYRNLPLKLRISMALGLVFHGHFEMGCGKINNIYHDFDEKMEEKI